MKMKNDKDLPTYITSDLYIAAALRASGFKLNDVTFNHAKKKGTFHFEKSTSLSNPEDIIEDYWDNRLLLDARTLINAIDELKSRLYAK